MRRMHIGLQVDDLDESIEFYKRLFGCEPTLRRSDYAKWMLDDPRVNFSLDVHGDGPPGSAHYGIQVESRDELEDMRTHIDAADLPRADQDDLVCGYQLQHKSWITDPNGLWWEAFFTEGVVDEGYGTPEMPDPA
ncbi:VOC family protein [Candidatus Poriferisodalis sp.]|uniref:VOC family protein n=1 Tax=Candidatus Poriferisodalis sp. TaxID=3101277 RepID=UPI003C6FAF5C